jgi:hypothetical protein
MNNIYRYLRDIVDGDSFSSHNCYLYDDVASLRRIVKKYSTLKNVSPKAVNMLLLAFVECYYDFQSQLLQQSENEIDLNAFKAAYIKLVKDYISTDDASIPYDNDKKSFGTIKIPFIVGPMSFISCQIKKAICDDTFIINKNGFYHCNIDSMVLVIDSKSCIYENAFCGSHIKNLKIVLNDLNNNILSTKVFDQIKSIDKLIIENNTKNSSNFDSWLSTLTTNKNIQYFEVEGSLNSLQLSEAVPQDLMKAYKAPIVNMKANDFRFNGFNRGEEYAMQLTDGTILRWVVVKANYNKALLYCYFSDSPSVNHPYTSDDSNYSPVTYEESKIRNEILTAMFNNFPENWKSKILTTNVEVSNPDNNTTTILQDKLFLPCEKDLILLKPFLKRYFNASFWGGWLRDVDKINGQANIYFEDAIAHPRNQTQSYFVYPMMWVINDPNYQQSYFDLHSVSNDNSKLSQIDYDKSNYIEISPKEALKQYKEDPLNLRVIVDNKVIIYDKDGKVDEHFRHRASPVSRPELNNITHKKTGESWFDAKCLSPNQLFNIADKIYMVSEVDNAKINDVRLYNKDFYRAPSNGELISLLYWFILREYNNWPLESMSQWLMKIDLKISDWNRLDQNIYFSQFKKLLLDRGSPQISDIMNKFIDFVQYYLDHYNELHSYILKKGYFIETLDKINELILEYNNMLDELQKYNSPESRLEEVKRLQSELEKLQSDVFRQSYISNADVYDIEDYFQKLEDLQKIEDDFETLKKEINAYKQKTSEILRRYKDGNLF